MTPHTPTPHTPTSQESTPHARTQHPRTQHTGPLRTGWAGRALGSLAAAVLLAVAVPSGVAVAAPIGPGSSASDQAQADQAQADQAAAQARAEAQAAERAARARQRAAVAAQRAQSSWDDHGRPNKMIIVRPTSVDSVTSGRLTQRVARSGGTLTLARLDSAVPASWISTADGVTRLGATLVLSPGVAMDVGGDVKTVQLTGGATAPEASSIYTGGGRLTVHDVTITSLDPASGRPVAPTAGGRPFVVVAAGGRLTATDATFSELGTPDDQPQDRAGIGFSSGSTGSLVRTTVHHNTTGIRLNASVGVRLEGVTVTESAANGLMLQGDQGTTLIGVRAERNTDNGVQVSGASTDRPITGIATTGNGQFGLAVISQDAPKISNVVTQSDGVGGLQLAGDQSPVVTGFTAIDQPIGVLTHVSSNHVTLDQLRISGGGRGVAIEKTTNGLALTGSTIERTQTGVSVGGQNIDLHDLLVDDSQSGVRVERGAGHVTATAVSLTGGENGVVVVPGTTSVVLRDLVIDGAANSGVRSSSPNAQILGGRISGSSTGIDVEAATTINGTEIIGSNVGIRSRSIDLVAADDVNVSAVTSGINVQDGSPFVLTDSRVDALEAVNGQAQYQGLNDLSLPPLNLLGAIGIPLVVLALLLDQVQRLRQRHGPGGPGRRLPPTLRAGAASAVASCVAGGDRGVRAGSPLRVGPVVDGGGSMPDRVQREPQDGRGDPRSAGRDHRTVAVDAGGLDRRRDGRLVGEPAVHDHAGHRQVQAAGHVSGTQAGTRLRRRSAEAIRRARVHNLRGAGVEGAADVGEIGHRGGIEPGGKGADRSRPLLAGFDPVPGRDPRRQAAVEDADVAGAEHGEHPPHPRRREEPGAVVHDDRHVLGDAERAHRGGERLGGGQHVRQRGIGVPHRVDVDADRARDVPGPVLRLRIAVHRRQVPRTVDDDQVRLVEMPGEPARHDERGGAHPRVNGSRVPPVSSTRTDLFSVYSLTAPTALPPITIVNSPAIRPSPVSPAADPAYDRRRRGRARATRVEDWGLPRRSGGEPHVGRLAAREI
jgi:Right handed beta helix region